MKLEIILRTHDQSNIHKDRERYCNMSKKDLILGCLQSLINSSNLVKSEYDVESKQMIVEFKNGQRYEYEEVPHKVYAEFRQSESQGKYFSTQINKKFDFKKL